MTIANQIQRIKTNITNAYQEIEKFNVNVTEYNNKSDKLAQAISQITVGDTINNQNKTITEKGFCWGASSKPTLSNNSITSSSTSDTFSANISGLSESTTYHIRAYVKTEDGKTFYGNDVAFSTTAKGVKIDKNGYGEDSNWTR